MKLAGRVALVTGASQGIGHACALALAREGATVVINYNQSAQKAAALCDLLTQQGQSAITWQCDITDSDAVTGMIEGIVEKCGRIDAVVNNASSTRPTPQDLRWWELDDALRMPWQAFSDEFDHSVRAVLNTVRASLPHMQAQGGGRIVNIVTEQWNEAGGSAHHVSGKAAMVSLTRWLVRRLAPHDITINMVSPGATHTERTAKRRAENAPKDDYELNVPLGQRRAEAEEIGDACVFFLSDLAKFISGAYLMVNGGRHPQMG